MRNSGFFIGLLVGVTLLAPSVSHADNHVFEMRYAGATTLQHFFMPEMSRIFFDDTEIRIHIEGGNTDLGIQSLLNGSVDMAGSGRLLTQAEKDQGLVEHLLGWDVLTVIVNRKNPVEDISMQQLQGIFSGDILNWQECGGPDLQVVVVTCPKGSGMRKAVQNLILRDRSFLERAVVSAIVAEADRHVAMFPGAIAVLSASMVDVSSVKIVKVNGVGPVTDSLAEGRYPLAKPLALITLGPPRDELEVFINLARGPIGRNVLAEYFVPLGKP